MERSRGRGGVTGVFWLEQRSRDVPAGNDWLGKSERALLANLRFEKRRLDWRLGRWTAKLAVSAYVGRRGEMAGIEILASPGGSPIALIADRRAPVSISLSHRAGVCLCAIAPVPTMLGCDVELIEPRTAAFIEDYFSVEEQELIRRAAEADRDRLTTLCWSVKESVLKALGVGLRGSTSDVHVYPAVRTSGRTWTPLRAHIPGEAEFQGWYREDRSLLRTIAVATNGR